MSIGRVMYFNKEKTKLFHEVLKSVLFEGEMLFVRDSSVFNVDENGLTICQRPQKIVAQNGQRRDATLTSAEKGNSVTIICCVSGAGMLIPPMMIFPPIRMKSELLDILPNGTIGAATKSR